MTYNLLVYSKSYSKTTGDLWKNYRDEPNSSANNGINYSIKGSESFDYKTKFVENVTAANLTKEEVETAIPLKHLSNFWRTLDIPSVKCILV